LRTVANIRYCTQAAGHAWHTWHITRQRHKALRQRD
jgi:hypothetical protein